jgi:hypothetical protein
MGTLDAGRVIGALSQELGPDDERIGRLTNISSPRPSGSPEPGEVA